MGEGIWVAILLGAAVGFPLGAWVGMLHNDAYWRRMARRFGAKSVYVAMTGEEDLRLKENDS